MNWFTWRRLHCLSDFRTNAWQRTDSDHIDAGYCLDRYHLSDAED